ncbi:enoyl-CoA hydratase-related protein [Mesorhizobium sp. ANAO-SY3R2]|uniref:enoyl-CoA hydratase-related protein n=1 Tax=Mesorhizobium sp. ANAO-SY3R2 TaxID=3166644 RepID=UPI0036735FB1
MSTVDAMSEALLQAAGDPGLRAVVIAAAGDTFSAGGDLGWMQAALNDPEGLGRRDVSRLGRLLETITTFPVPVIARVNGAAYGGGFGLVCSSDIAIASSNATFGLTEVRLGVVAGTISPCVLRRIGAPAMRVAALTGGIIDCDAAMRMGLVQQVVPPEQLDAAVEATLSNILRASPEAVRASKQLVHRLCTSDESEWSNIGVDAIVAAWQTSDAKEGIAAFLEKRRPQWG